MPEPVTEPVRGQRGPPPVEQVVVVVPAHDEEVVLGRCLDAIAGAAEEARAVGVRVDGRGRGACTVGAR